MDKEEYIEKIKRVSEHHDFVYNKYVLGELEYIYVEAASSLLKETYVLFVAKMIREGFSHDKIDEMVDFM